VYFYTAVNLL